MGRCITGSINRVVVDVYWNIWTLLVIRRPIVCQLCVEGKKQRRKQTNS